MASTDSLEHVAIVGGGIIGTACAWYLSQAGLKVTILEKDTITSGCSFENCGYVCPSHALPLNQPGALATTLKAMMKTGSPLYVNPLVGPSLWSWLIRFSLRCNEKDMMQAGHARNALLQSSRQLYSDLVRQHGLECEFTEKGLLIVYQDPAGMGHAEKEAALLKTHWDIPTTIYDGAGLCKLEPALKAGLAGAVHFETDAHVNPSRLMTHWRALNEQQGVEYREQCRVSDFVIEGGRIKSVKTSSGEVDADAVVLATGALGPVLGKILGEKLHIQPGKGYSITTNRPSRCAEIPMIFHDHRVAVTPFQETYRLGSTMEFNGYNTELNEKRIELLKTGASHYLDEPLGDSALSRWYGWRPMSASGIPRIGKGRSVKNAYVAAGHSMLGTSMGPATGKLIAELITGQEPHLDPQPYS
jgi:D-amino-acid dehydrogenase